MNLKTHGFIRSNVDLHMALFIPQLSTLWSKYWFKKSRGWHLDSAHDYLLLQQRWPLVSVSGPLSWTGWTPGRCGCWVTLCRDTDSCRGLHPGNMGNIILEFFLKYQKIFLNLKFLFVFHSEKYSSNSVFKLVVLLSCEGWVGQDPSHGCQGNGGNLQSSLHRTAWVEWRSVMDRMERPSVVCT